MRRALLFFLVSLLAVLAVAALVVFGARGIRITILIIQWGFLSEPYRQLIQIAVAVLTTLLAALLSFFLQLLLPPRRSSLNEGHGFPFERFSTSEIDLLKKWLGVQHADLEYQPRLPPERQPIFESQLDTGLLILTGRAGLGKTRECIDLFSRLARSKGEEVTILCPREDFDRPRDNDIPPDFAPRNVVLFIDDVDQRCTPPRRGGGSVETHTRSFHDRLSATVAWMSERYAGRDWRVVVTARDEPHLRVRVRLDADVWSGFKQYQLPGVNPKARPDFIRAVARYFGLDISETAIEYIAQKSDGTCSGIVTALARESSRRSGVHEPLTVEDLSQYEFRYPADWERQVYRKTIATHPERRSVFEALSGLYQLRIPPDRFLVVDLASRLCQRRGPEWLRKRRLGHTISRDLRAWMFEYRGQVFCSASYLEGRTEVEQVLPRLLLSLRQAIKKQEVRARLLPSLIEAGYRIGLDLGHPYHALSLLQVAIRHVRDSAPLWMAVAVLEGRLGRSRKSLDAAEAACRADSQSSVALVVLAYAQSQMGLHDCAIRSARQATWLTPTYDFAWLNLGVVLSKRGLYDEAISALRRACELNPQSAKAWYSLGVAYDRSGKLADAIEACMKAARLDPLDAIAWHTLGIAYDRSGQTQRALEAWKREAELADTADDWCRLSVAYGKAGYPEDAASAARKAIDLDSDHVGAWCSLAINLTHMHGKEEEAQKARVRIGELSITADDWCRLSVAYGKAGYPEDAASAARKAIGLESGHVEAWRSLAMNLGNLPGKERETLEAWKREAELADTADDWWHLSMAYGKAGYPEDAASAARKAIGLESGHVEAWRSLAMNLGNLPGKERETLEAWKREAELADTADDWCRLSVTCRMAGLYEDAIAATDRALGLDSDYVEAWRARAATLDEMGHSRDAVIAWKRADELTVVGNGPDYAAAADEVLHELEKEPASFDGWKRLASAYRRAGRAEEAVFVARDAVRRTPQIGRHVIGLVAELMTEEPHAVTGLMELLVALDSANGEYMHLLGVARRKAGQLAPALVALRAACDLMPERENYWYALGRVHEDLGEKDAAHAAYEKAVQLRPNYVKARLALRRV